MLSYQHAYHAGNLADLHKHALLSVMLDYLTRKDKPLSYLETHGGRGLYDLSDASAVKTGEAAQGIQRPEVAGWFKPDHPYARAITKTREAHGPDAYPGSPLIAATLLREIDSLQVCELHPQEYQALFPVMKRHARLHNKDGLEMAVAMTPPTPRRGLIMIDPSWEVKTDYTAIPKLIDKLVTRWNVGIIALWYPVLENRAQAGMVARLVGQYPEALSHEVRFPPAREGHGMIGSGMFIINPPFGLDGEAKRLTKLFSTL
ncbi:23S rRNA (adenine(2030)-N(6))-methyltransferase RlmJ [Thioclava sp. GXIMD4216]|uniref:23S rRNA (adenine(2030)-N(6))-methyltransferase RlmJ n=1 Tax=Thioclava sp. GXIMD4216 TaxID=3131929 RepID=UPI0030D5084A